MEYPIYVVDAFTHQQFKGNAAAVIPVMEWPASSLMQQIAIENNLSETAFIKRLAPNCYAIRWFSPLTEIDFCGHATLASSFVIFNFLGGSNEIEFVTEKVGSLFVQPLSDCRYEMSFPNQLPEPVAVIPPELLDGLSVKPLQVLKNRQAYFAIFPSSDEVRSVVYQSESLKQLAPYDVVVTAAARDYDFVSRYFWPASGGDEDPVTGSIHSGLAPFWAHRLGKTELVAYQASARGGVLYCQVAGDRVLVAGDAVLYLQGRIIL